MAELSTAARPYAKAVFELAQSAGTLADWSRQLQALAALVADPQVAALIGHPAVSREQLAGLLIDGAKLSDDGARNLVKLLAENKRLPLLPMIAEQFEALKNAAEQRVDVEITTAAAVDEAERKTLVDAVARRLSREVAVSWHTDETLLAGARIRAGDLVIDASMAAELDKLRHALVA